MANEQINKSAADIKTPISMLTSAFQKSFRLQVHFRGLSFRGVSTNLGTCVGVVRQHLGGQVCGDVQRLRAGCHFLSLNRNIYPEQLRSTCSFRLSLLTTFFYFTKHNNSFVSTAVFANLHKHLFYQATQALVVPLSVYEQKNAKNLFFFLSLCNSQF